MRSIFAIFVAGVLLVGSGCSSVYMQDRGNDFRDVVKIGITYGPGTLVNARATKLVQVGLGALDAYKVGIDGRAYGHWKEFRAEGGVSFIYFIGYEKEFIVGNEVLEEKIADIVQKKRTYEVLADLDPFHGDRGFAEIGVTAHLFAFGVEVAIDFYSFLDFLGGWLLLDPEQDDIQTIREKEGNTVPAERTKKTTARK